MNERTGPRGGVLLDLFLIAVLCAAGAWAWFNRAALRERAGGLLSRGPSWSRGWRLPSAPALPALSPAAEKDAPAVLPPSPGVVRESARLRDDIRALLSSCGVTEKYVLRAVGRGHSASGVSWVEETLEIEAPPRFHSGRFLKSLVPVLSRRSMAVMEDVTEGGQWTLSVGDRVRIYQRLVFHQGVKAAMFFPWGEKKYV